MTDDTKIFGLTGEELAKIGQQAAQEAREESFAKGLPVTFERNGITLREYPDGHIETVSGIVQAAE